MLNSDGSFNLSSKLASIGYIIVITTRFIIVIDEIFSRFSLLVLLNSYFLLSLENYSERLLSHLDQ